MPTPLDRALQSRNAVLGMISVVHSNASLTSIGFAGLIGAVAVWSIWGGDMFPKEPDPTGGERLHPVWH